MGLRAIAFDKTGTLTTGNLQVVNMLAAHSTQLLQVAAALETADIVLMGDRLERLEHAIRLGRCAQSIVKPNIVFALSFVVVLFILNFTGNITLPFGVLGYEGSTVLVTLSGLRLLINR